jgi:hypothetical protein
MRPRCVAISRRWARANAGPECLDRDYRTTCLTAAISRGECAGHTTNGAALADATMCAHVPWPIHAVQHRTTSKPLIDSLSFWLMVRAGVPPNRGPTGLQMLV